MLISVLTRFASNFSISFTVFSSLLINWFWTNEVNMHMHSNIVENHCTICSLQSHFSAEIYEETLRQKKLVLVFQEQQKPTIAKNLCTILILVPLVPSACKWRQIVTTRNWSVGQKVWITCLRSAIVLKEEKKMKESLSALFLILHVRNCIFTRRNIWCFSFTVFKFFFAVILTKEKKNSIRCAHNCFIAKL